MLNIKAIATTFFSDVCWSNEDFPSFHWSLLNFCLPSATMQLNKRCSPKPSCLRASHWTEIRFCLSQSIEMRKKRENYFRCWFEHRRETSRKSPIPSIEQKSNELLSTSINFRRTLINRIISSQSFSTAFRITIVEFTEIGSLSIFLFLFVWTIDRSIEDDTRQCEKWFFYRFQFSIVCSLKRPSSFQ